MWVLREVGIADGGQAELSETWWHPEAVAGAPRLAVMGANIYGLCENTAAPGSAPKTLGQTKGWWKCRQREGRDL